MIEGDLIYLIFCSIGGFNCIIFALFIIKVSIKHYENLLLSVILLTSGLSLLSKNFPYLTNELNIFNNDSLIYTLWFIACTIKAPCLYFYTIFLIRRQKLIAKDFIHLSPFIVYYLIFLVFEKESAEHIAYAAFFIQILYLGYLILFLFVFVRDNKHISERIYFLQRAILIYSFIRILVLFFWFRYSLLLDAVSLMSYVYILCYLEIKNNFFSKPPYKIRKYESIKFDYKELANKTHLIDEYVKKNKIYLNPDINLNKLALMLKVKPYIISAVINESFKANFNEYINKYRIEHAKWMLTDIRYQDLTILYISSECGFSSISSFNSFFKKLTNYTPNQYRKQMINTKKCS